MFFNLIKNLVKGVSIEFSFPSDEEFSCKGKVKYGHEQTAVKAAEYMMNKGSKPLEAYKCRYCDGWHIGGC